MRGAAAVIALAVTVIACSESEKKPKPLSEPGEKLYTLRGQVVGHSADDNTLRIDHEAIPRFMDAMTMDYSVRGAKVTELPPAGSRVEAKLHVTDNGYWLTDVKKAP
ncbi:MAG TPA: copper-binding protein [Thermoanaerobaculia bacterium]|jgi:protein SCO1/2|nr:copper-binding protein [Thermoanaerobaculia bacterium]